MRILTIFILALLLWSPVAPVWAARGFGATDGTTTTDRIETTFTTLNANTSWSMWFWLNGAGQGVFDRLFDKDGTVNGSRYLYHDNAAAKLGLAVQWTINSGT